VESNYVLRRCKSKKVKTNTHPQSPFGEKVENEQHKNEHTYLFLGINHLQP
jgi:hypothetical protein